MRGKEVITTDRMLRDVGGFGNDEKSVVKLVVLLDVV